MNEMILRESLQAKDSGKRVDPDTIISYAGNIESAGRSLLSIINDILDFSKIEAGRMQLVEADYKLSSVLNDVCNMVFFRAKEKGLRFSIDVDETIPDSLYGDEVRLRQAITNIAGNAVKYTNEGEIRLSVHTGSREKREAGQNLWLIVAVQDTGIGIQEEDIKKLFTKFQRVNMEQNRTVEGTGLGLAITYKLLDMMGGDIQVESQYGEGSTFTIKVPQRIRSCDPIGCFQTRFQQNMMDTRAFEESFQAPEAHIMIVDDTSMNLTVVVGLLKNTRMIIDTATSGAGAIDLAKTTSYDLILMDQRMPEMDGTETLHHIRELEGNLNRATPVICLTADAVIGARERYIAEGFTDYLTKPIDSHALERMLMKYLPGEKVMPVQKEEQTSRSDTGAALSDHNYVLLRKVCVNPEIGLKYCQNDESFYHTILREYAQSAAEKEAALQRCYEEQDWKNYAIQAHALKSTSKMIGANELSSLAARLETAGNQIDVETICLVHPEMMKDYLVIVDALTAYADIEDAREDDDEILEFLPE